MIDTLIKRISVTYQCYEMYAHSGEKVQMLVLWDRSRNGRHLINYRHCLWSLSNRHEISTTMHLFLIFCESAFSRRLLRTKNHACLQLISDKMQIIRTYLSLFHKHNCFPLGMGIFPFIFLVTNLIRYNLFNNYYNLEYFLLPPPRPPPQI
jgi:hypothetical protein